MILYLNQRAKIRVSSPMKSNGAQYAALVSRHVRKNVNGNFKQHQKMNKRTGSPAINHNKILSFFQALWPGYAKYTK